MKILVNFKQEISDRGEIAVSYLVQKIEERIYPEYPLREAVLHYPVNGGGKGFRPAMIQLITGAFGGDEKLAIPVAAAIEAVHVSSLIHDDFMDKDNTRRGVEAVWTKWDPTIAILAGDALVAIGFTLAGEVNNVSDEMRYRFVKDLANVYIQLCHGQMLDISFEDMDFDQVDETLINNMQYLKTGVLFEFACVSGAILALSEMSGPRIEKIRNYAKQIGTAFQIQDDIIGLVGKKDEIGKPVGSDIIEGKKTLIVSHAIKNANDEQKKILNSILGNKSANNGDIDQCLEVINQIGSIDYAKEIATSFAEKALSNLQILPNNQYTDILKEFTRYIVERKF